jgi:thymidylate kinase
MTKYICLEGGEGCYKTTTAKALAIYYRAMGLRVLVTKEPGTPHIPVTMELRKIMLSNEYDSSLTRQARELISQAIRSIHLEKLILPAIESGEYDLIIQDRGILSGQIYGEACGNNGIDLNMLNEYIHGFQGSSQTHYDHLFIFHNIGGLKTATECKDEFGVGDAMESRGTEFHRFITDKFIQYGGDPDDVTSWTISHHDVHGKTTGHIVSECVKILGF